MIINNSSLCSQYSYNFGQSLKQNLNNQNIQSTYKYKIKYVRLIIIQMGYQRERDKQRYRGDYRQEQPPRYRRRSRSRSDSERRERHHSNQRDYDYQRRDDRHYSRHSRSRSREKRSDDESKAEEKEQKIRVALRNNTINYDLGIHEMFMKLPEQKRQELAEQAMAPERIHECILVRQLYVSGMYEAGEPMIRSFFSKYGEIEDVEIIKNFVFVKYFKVEDASNACADYHNINTTLHHNTHNANFKIFFADHLKRFNVVSNSPQFQVKEHLIPVVYASVRNDPQFANQQYLHSIFSRFGFIRNMQVKRNQLPTQRTYVLVQYQTLAMALRARQKMRQQRDKLGDRKSQITILIDNQKITRLYPNINNQIRYQKKRQSTTTQPGQPNTSTQPVQLPQHDSFNYQTFQTDSKQDFDIDGIMGIINEHAGNAEFQEEHLSADWCGFLTRNKSKKVEVDFFRIHKEPIELDEGILNVSYRADLREALESGAYILAGRFRASQQSQAQFFKQEYLGYFTRKGRAGVMMTPKYLIYLIPPLPELNINYPIRPDQLLALFFKMP